MSNREPEISGPPDIDRFAGIFKALSNPNRLRILLELSQCGGPQGQLSTTLDQVENCQREFAVSLGLAPSTISHHFKELRQAGLLNVWREGKNMVVRVDTQVLASVRSLFGPAGQ